MVVRSRTEPRGASRVAITWFEDVVVDRFVNQADLPGVDLEIVVDLGTQAVGIHDDRVSDTDRTLVIQTAVRARTDADRLRNGERVHCLHVDDQ